MKDLIIQALDNAMILAEKQVPSTKRVSKSISILDVRPIDLLSFMKDNNIPDDAEFYGRDNGYDGWDDIQLSWYVEIPTTETDKLKDKKNTFNNSLAWRCVYDLLLLNGYKRAASYYSGDFKQFDDTTIYDMYIKGDFDRLVKYYSLRFIKE